MSDLEEIFYNTKTGYGSLSDLWKKAKHLGYNYDEVKVWFNNQPINQIYKKKTKVKRHQHIISPYLTAGALQADLMVLKKYAHKNNGYKYLLNVIDIYTRYAWCIPLKSKKADQVAPHLEMIIKKIQKRWKPKKIIFTFDKGTEFEGEVLDMFEKYGVEKHVNDPHSLNSHNTMGIVERLNKTIGNKIKKIMAHKQSLTYIDEIGNIISNYNRTTHSATMRKPFDSFMRKQRPFIMIDVNDYKVEPEKDKYKVGDFVRFMKKDKTFNKKGFVPTYSLNVHKIVEKKGLHYVLDNGKKYYEEQLIKAKEGDNKKKYKTKVEKVKKEEKIKRENKKEFGTEDIKQFIVEGKRERKPRKRFIEEM